MTITRANLETVLVQRAGALMTFAGLATDPADGTNSALNDPIGYALRQAGYGVANIAAVIDSDLAVVNTSDIDKLLDLAEYRLLETIQGNLDDVDSAVGQVRESYGQIGERLEKRLARLQKKIAEAYGLGLSTLQAGVISLNFAEHNEG